MASQQVGDQVARRRGLIGLCSLAVAALLAGANMPSGTKAQSAGLAAQPLSGRHIGVSREEANRTPRSEADQTIVDGWPLYRTERGQAAFNAAMATLKATDGPAPARDSFKGCQRLECNLSLPAMTEDGWMPAGRFWVSPTEYVLIVHTPRNGEGRSYRRLTGRALRYFIFHEFHNRTQNTDPYDTISSHSGRIFVPFYMGKQSTDARGRRFVVVLQVAPYDVSSIHATNWGSMGPGIEVAKNTTDTLEPLQALAGILVATMVKTDAPHLRVVHHRGSEGLPMLQAYEARLAALRARSGGPALSLPFVQATASRVASASGRLEEVLWRRGQPPRTTVAETELVAPRPMLLRPPRPKLQWVGQVSPFD